MYAPSDLIDVKFEKAVAFGYRTEEVDDYVAKVSQTLTALLQEKQMLEDKLEILAGKVEEYRDDEESLRAALLGAQKLGDSIVREAKAKAENLMRDAVSKSEALVGEADSRAKGILAEANQNAASLVGDANFKAESILNHATSNMEKEKQTLQRMQKEVADFKNTLLVMYKRHLELISELPDPASEKEADFSTPPPTLPKPSGVVKPFPIEEAHIDDEEPKRTDAAEEPANFDDESGNYPAEPPRKRTSRFGELKFGADFDPVRENDAGRRRKEK